MPAHDVHDAFVTFARSLLPEPRTRSVFDRLAERSGIAHRFSPFAPGEPGAARIDTAGFYIRDAFPGTAARMAQYARHAPDLAVQALAGLGEIGGATHLIVASCTGFTAPGLDQVIAERLALSPQLKRTLVGFMGCYGAVPALRAAQDAVLANPSARVLVVNVELCSLHMQQTSDIATVLSFLLFGDGATAALVTSEPGGIELGRFHSVAIPDTAGLITWKIGDQGFEMFLSGKVPAVISATLRAGLERNDGEGILQGARPADIVHWAVHAGGRTVLDAVEHGLRLGRTALDVSRGVLHDVGNVSSATLMFVLSRMLGAEPGPGAAMAFGPGLSAETFRFEVLQS